MLLLHIALVGGSQQVVAFGKGGPGRPECPCTRSPSAQVQKVDCGLSFAVNGTCVVVPKFASAGFGDDSNVQSALYPGDYGLSCQTHKEPAQKDCFDLSANVELPAAQRAGWCDNSWCYVDPNNCTVEPKTSTYWGGDVSQVCVPGVPNCPLYYSYATCDGIDGYTGKAGQMQYTSRIRETMIMNVRSRMLRPLTLLSHILPVFETQFFNVADPVSLAAFVYTQTQRR